MRRMITGKQAEQIEENKEQFKNVVFIQEKIGYGNPIVKSTEEYSYFLPIEIVGFYNSDLKDNEIKMIPCKMGVLDIDLDDSIYGKLPSTEQHVNIKCKTKMTDEGLLIELEDDINLNFEFENGKKYDFFEPVPYCPLDPTGEYIVWNNVGSSRKNWKINMHSGQWTEIEDIEDFTWNTNDIICIGYTGSESIVATSGNFRIRKGQYLLTISE